MIRAIQIAASLWRIYRVQRGPVEVLQLIGEVHCVSPNDYRASHAVFERWYAVGEPQIVPVDGGFRTFQKACEALL